MAAGPLAGSLSDRLPSRWPVVQGALVLGVGGFCALALARGAWSIAGGVAFVALGAGGLVSVLVAIVGDKAAADRPGIAMGSLATVGDIGSAAGPLLAYPLAAALGLRSVYLLCAAVLSLGLFAVARQRRTR